MFTAYIAYANMIVISWFCHNFLFQFLLLTLCKVTLSYMWYKKGSLYFEGRKSTQGYFSTWHSQWTPVNSSSHSVFVWWFSLHSQFVPLAQCYQELQYRNQCKSINIRNIFLLTDFIASFEISKINLFKEHFEQSPFQLKLLQK